MHDCPRCGVPLHGHEQNCPSCGERQQVRISVPQVPAAPGVNMVPVVIVILVFLGGLFAVAQMTWIGQMMRQGPQQVDPLAKLTFLDARNIVEQKINEGLTAVGAKGKLTWKNGENPVDKTVSQSVQLTVDTKLSDPTQRKAIIDPVKDYLEKAQITTLTMTDSKSHATWTYNVTAGAQAQPAGEEGPAQPPPAQ